MRPVLEKIASNRGWVIQAGPFAGMQYVQESKGSVLVPKLLGLYEHELHGAIQSLALRMPDAVVDVGCAEGYYAVGMARIIPTATVFAFDINPDAQSLCALLAKLNGVETRVRVDGVCDSSDLQTILRYHRHVLVISDCEGYEGELLDPDKAPELANTDLLIEVHEFAKAGVTNELLRRFGPTHHITRIPTRPIKIEGIASLREFEPTTRRKIMGELRPDGMEWFVCLPRNSGNLTEG